MVTGKPHHPLTPLTSPDTNKAANAPRAATKRRAGAALSLARAASSRADHHVAQRGQGRKGRGGGRHGPAEIQTQLKLTVSNKNLPLKNGWEREDYL